MSEVKHTFKEDSHKLVREVNYFGKYQSEISSMPAKNELDSWIRLRVQASVAAGIYSGFEKLMEIYADHSESNIDRTKIEGSSYHKQLLDLIFDAIPDWDYSNRSILSEILKFRHFYRHNFAWDLDTEKTGRIVEIVLLNIPRLIDEFNAMYTKLDSKPISKIANVEIEEQREEFELET